MKAPNEKTKNPLNVHAGQFIVQAREQMGLSQMDLVRLSKVSQSNVGAMEKRHNITYFNLAKMLGAMGYELVLQKKTYPGEPTP